MLNKFRYGLFLYILAYGLLNMHNTYATSAALETQTKSIKMVSPDAPPEEGCWRRYSSGHAWEHVTCNGETTYLHKFKGAEYYNVGAGIDYSALTTKLTQNATGTFPAVTGVKFATNDGNPGEDIFSLQLNTNLSDTTTGGFVKLGNNSPYCSRHHYNACSTWQQFAYLNKTIFIQNWLFISNSDTCPSGWNDQGPGREFRSCWKNSGEMLVSKVPVAELDKISLKGIIANGLNTIMFTDNKGMIAATSQKDDTLDISSTWKQSEFNVFSSNSETTKFNPGVSLTVRLLVDDGTTNSPTCIGPSKGGTTAESTNLNLGKCHAFSGTPAGIEFTQSN